MKKKGQFKEMVEERCPACGYCKHCGQSRMDHPRPWYPYWMPYWTYNGTISGSYTSTGGDYVNTLPGSVTLNASNS